MSTSDKTEKATPKRKKDERKKGNIAKSKDFSSAITFIGVIIVIYFMSGNIIKELKNLIGVFLKVDIRGDMNDKMIGVFFTTAMTTFIKVFIPVGLVILVLGVISNIIQGGFVFSKEAIKPKFSKLNPLNGLKNMFSKTTFINCFKNIILLILLTYIGYSFVKGNYINLLKMGYVYFPNLIYLVVEVIKKLFNNIMIVVVVIGIVDFAYQLYSHQQKLKMTKQEVKEEFKQAEGNPLIKSQIRQKQRQLLGKRMVQNAKDATVIVTNPTHIAIAIRYEKDVDSAPIVTAKGADLLAAKIREIARENNIPIIENKPLARMMYKKVEIDEEVPADMYEAVAQVLIAVYKIKNRYKQIR